MKVDEKELEYEADSAEIDIGEDGAEESTDVELLTIQVDEDLEKFNKENLEDSDDAEAENMAESYAEQEIIEKLLKESISIAEATEILSQKLSFEEAQIDGIEVDEIEVDDATDIKKDYEDQEKLHMRKQRRKNRRHTMPVAMTGLMGEANVKLATGQFAEAEKMCLELIRRYPLSSEPFETLAMIYDEKNMPLKSVQYWFISAFLSSNPDTWEKLAQMFANQLNDPRQAVFCYSRAISVQPMNIDLHWSRAKLIEYMGESAKAVKCYIYMMKFLQPDQGNLGIELAIEMATIHHSNDNIRMAQDTLEKGLIKYKSFVTGNAINLLLEILLQQNNHSRCIQVLVEQNLISLGSEDVTVEEFVRKSLPEQVIIATYCTNPKDMPSDLMAKFAIALIHLNKFTIADYVVDVITKENVDEFGDLFLEISEAYYQNNKFEKSISLLKSLLNCDKFNRAAVWLQYAQALSGANQLDEAADAYSYVVQLAPQHTTTRIKLSNILKTLGRTTEALSVLSQADIEGPLDSTILYNKCQMLKERKQTDEFIQNAQLLMQRHFLNLRSKDEVDAIINLKKIKNKHDTIRDMRAARGELKEACNEYVGEDISVDQQWPIFIDLCEALFNEGRFTELESLSFNALGSTKFMTDPKLSKEIEFICLIACIQNNSFFFAYNIVREIVLQQPECPRAWNLLCYVISNTDDIRHNKFLLRLTYKYHDSLPLSVLNGHNCLAAGSYKYALAEYTQVFKQEPNDPLISLMLGLTYIHMACQKFSGNKHDLTIKGAALVQTYLKSRGECQESYYNLGRAMHQLNILPQALHYYKKALEMPPVIQDDGDFDLTKEIAFNLSLVYKNSENSKIIRYYICKYINV